MYPISLYPVLIRLRDWILHHKISTAINPSHSHKYRENIHMYIIYGTRTRHTWQLLSVPPSDITLASFCTKIA